MFQLFNPISLTAAAAVILPVLLHLWNKRKGKTLKVGSIALLKESSKTTSKSIRITEWPLLLLRCLLIILAAILLARPYWQHNATSGKRGWILIPGHQFSSIYQQHKGIIDSLMQSGFELRDLQRPDSKISLTAPERIDERNGSGYSNYWSDIKYLNKILPAQYPVYIFSEQLLENFAGERPATRLDLHWIKVAHQSNADTTVISRHTGQNGKVITTSFITTEHGNQYEQTRSDQPIGDTADKIYVGVFAGRNITDARYLKAAIEAIAAYSGRKITITEELSSIPLQAIFWLQDTPPDEKIITSLSQGGTLLQYENPGKSFIRTFSPASPGYPSLTATDPSAFYQYTSGVLKGNAVWTFSNGEPVMTAVSNGSSKTIYFRSRFNPQWTDIVWKENFVRFLLPLILPASPLPAKDLRRMPAEQATPRIEDIQQPGDTEHRLTSKTDLSFPLWVLLCFVLLAERILAHRKTSHNND